MGGRSTAEYEAVEEPPDEGRDSPEEADVREVGSPDSPSDGALVRRARDGDRWAEEALFRRYVHDVTGTVMRLLGDRAEAEDVVQDTFVAALSELRDLRDPSSFRPWLVRIAIHKVHRRFRRRRLRRALGLHCGIQEVAFDHLVTSWAAPELRTELAMVWRALEDTPSKQRTAWALRMVEGYSLAEAADACGCSLATVKRHIAAAQKRIDRAIGAQGVKRG